MTRPGGSSHEGSRAAVVCLRPLTRADRAVIRSWLADGTVRAWWGPPAAVEAEIAIATESTSAVCRMIEVDGTAVGYAHAFDTGLMETHSTGRPEPGMWQCAFFVGSEAHRGLGIGAVALDLLANEVFSTTLAIGCETRIPVRNEVAVREIEAKRFRWRHIESDAALGPVWIMRRDRGI
ncbi:MAG: GNAT family N-acetyltransferase [Hyphomicrobiaceae bacterium]